MCINNCNQCNSCNPCNCAQDTNVDHTPNLLGCDTLVDTMELLKSRFEACNPLAASDLDLLVDVLYSVRQCTEEYSNGVLDEINNLVVNFTPQDVNLESEVATAINLLPNFSVSENEIAMFDINVNGVAHKYVSKIGKGSYGVGGASLFLPADIYLISKESVSNQVVMKVINYGSAASPIDAPVLIHEHINNLPTNLSDPGYKTIGNGEIPLFVGFVSGGRSGGFNNKYILNNISTGTYGVGGTITLTASDLILVETSGTGGVVVPPYEDDPNAVVVDLGELPGGDYLTAIDALAGFTITSGTNYYFEFTVSGSRFVYGFDGPNGNYGTGGDPMLDAYLFLVYDEQASPIEEHEGYTENGKRADSNLVVTIGDYDGSGNGTVITLADSSSFIGLNAETVSATMLSVANIDAADEKVLITKEWVGANVAKEHQVKAKRQTANAAATFNFDLDSYSQYVITMTADTLFGFTNPPAADESQTISCRLSGNFLPTFPAYATVRGDAYDGLVVNNVYINYIDSDSGNEIVDIVIENLV